MEIQNILVLMVFYYCQPTHLENDYSVTILDTRLLGINTNSLVSIIFIKIFHPFCYLNISSVYHHSNNKISGSRLALWFSWQNNRLLVSLFYIQIPCKEWYFDYKSFSFCLFIFKEVLELICNFGWVVMKYILQI